MQVPGPGDRFVVRTDGPDSHGVGAQSRANDGTHLTQSEKHSHDTRLDQRSKKRLYSETEAGFPPSTDKTAHEIEALLDLLEGRAAKLRKKDPELLQQLLSKRFANRDSALAQALSEAVGADDAEATKRPAEISQDRSSTSETIAQETQDSALADDESTTEKRAIENTQVESENLTAEEQEFVFKWLDQVAALGAPGSESFRQSQAEQLLSNVPQLELVCQRKPEFLFAAAGLRLGDTSKAYLANFSLGVYQLFQRDGSLSTELESSLFAALQLAQDLLNHEVG